MQFKRVAVLLTLTASAALAQSAFDGTWALNQDKSKMTGITMTFSADGPGAMKFTNSETSYTFKTDGSPTTTPMGNTESWKQEDANTYESTSSRNGTQLSDTKWTLSPDNKTLNFESNGTRPDGEKWSDTGSYTRLSGTKGLEGRWKNSSFKENNPATMTMKMDSGNEMVWDISSEKATWKGKLDGKDEPATGPTVPDGLTLAVSKISPTSFKMVEKMKGKPLYIGTYSVAADGKTMNVHGTNGEGKEPTSVVWEKQ